MSGLCRAVKPMRQKTEESLKLCFTVNRDEVCFEEPPRQFLRNDTIYGKELRPCTNQEFGCFIGFCLIGVIAAVMPHRLRSFKQKAHAA